MHIKYIYMHIKYISMRIKYISMHIKYISMDINYSYMHIKYISMHKKYISMHIKYISMHVKYISCDSIKYFYSCLNIFCSDLLTQISEDLFDANLNIVFQSCSGALTSDYSYFHL